MKFCPECGKILNPTKKNKDRVLICNKCGYEEAIEDDSEYEVAEKVEHRSSDVTEVIEISDEDGLSEAEIEERRERFVENIDFFESE